MIGLGKVDMRMRICGLLLGVGLSALTGFGAHAFTMEGKSDTAGKYDAPKFDLEEQAKNFRKDGSGGTTSSGMYSTPFGQGTLQFGVTQGSGSGFNSATSPSFGPNLLGAGSIENREHYNRITAPPSSLEFSGVR